MNTEATDLKLYIDNEGDLHRTMGASILKNLATKKARGIYKHDLAVKGFGYLVEAGAKKYARDFASSPSEWHKIFSVATRKQVAEALTKSFEEEYKLGNYDHLLPKKYQKPSKASHATKKSTKWKTPEGLKIQWAPVNNAWFALWPGRGRVEDQHVLKTANTEDMHNWLRSTYGEQYGIATRTKKGASHATMSRAYANKSPAQLDREIAQFVARGRR